MSRNSKSHHRVPKSGDKDTRSTDAEPSAAKGYRKIHLSELPIIDLNSGPIITHIRDALSQYCQRELGPISNIFTEGRYRPPATADFNAAEIEADPTGVRKEVASAREVRRTTRSRTPGLTRSMESYCSCNHVKDNR